MKREPAAGHLLALFTILVWGTTFISTKLLLRAFAPTEVLFCRFLLGWLALWLVRPRALPWLGWRKELTFAAAGLSGVTLYYLLENIALTCTQASNVGFIVSASPFFIALLSLAAGQGERPGPAFFLGFAAAMGGICLITFGGGADVNLHPAGDLLALLAAGVWAVYSLLTRRLGGLGCDAVQTTRRTFGYGLLFMAPFLAATGFHPDLSQLRQPVYLGNLLFLGLCACAACFVTWNLAVRRLGAMRAGAYIYLVPVITLAASVLVLGERVPPLAGLGMALTLAGLLLSEGRLPGRKKTIAERGEM